MPLRTINVSSSAFSPLGKRDGAPQSEPMAMGTIFVQYRAQRPDGTFETVHRRWDVKSNKKI